MYIFSESASKTEFGKEHGFESIKTHADFVEKVPIRDYEKFKDYIEKLECSFGSL